MEDPNKTQQQNAQYGGQYNQQQNARYSGQYNQQQNTQYGGQYNQQQNTQYGGQYNPYQAPWQNQSPRGPVGQPRSPGMCIFLTIITCGIYGIYWLYQACSEINRYSNRIMTNTTIVIISIFVPFLCFISWYQLDEGIFQLDCEEGRPAEKRFVIWILLSLIGLGGFFMTYQVQKSLNRIWAQYIPVDPSYII